MAAQQIFGEKMFFGWTFQDKKGSFWAILIVSMIITLLLFPIWPIKMKIVAFYSSLYLLIFLVTFLTDSCLTKQIGFIVIRIALYLLLRIFGIEFWILPEIFESV